jgi:toxin HigB-1
MKRVILSYRDKRTRSFAVGKPVKAFSGFERAARRKLDRDRQGQFSIRLNDQWRICFEWPGKAPGPSNVEIIDYH